LLGFYFFFYNYSKVRFSKLFAFGTPPPVNQLLESTTFPSSVTAFHLFCFAIFYAYYIV